MNTVNIVADIEELTAQIRAFADARDWGQFHTPRNLVLALAGEVGELAAEIQWVSDDAIAQALGEPGKHAAVKSEIADVAIYVLRLADKLGINLAEAIALKLHLNEQRYPVEQARGNARKYTELRES
ncbi:MAG: nucleotide pyrophosphohydrolase [Akkermansiaceae bacterium]|nr:nucleotide pyrophosphohydrolase [Akkermansiaceae bacterium]